MTAPSSQRSIARIGAPLRIRYVSEMNCAWWVTWRDAQRKNPVSSRMNEKTEPMMTRVGIKTSGR